MVTFMLLMTSLVTSDARAAYDTIDAFGSGEGSIDINFTDWSGGYDNTSITVRMPKWSSALNAWLDIGGTAYRGETTTVTIDNGTDLARGTSDPADHLTHDERGFHLDLNTIGLFRTPVYNMTSWSSQNITSVDTADMYDDGRNATLISDPDRGRSIIVTRTGAGGSASFFYATGRPVVAKIGQMNVDSDEDHDFVMGTEESKELIVWLSLTSGWYGRRHNISVGRPVRDLVIADVTNDSRDDMVVAAGDGHAMIYMQKSDGTFKKVFDQNLSTGGLSNSTYRIRGCAVGDFDNDGLNDTAWTFSTSNDKGYNQKYGFVKVCYQDSTSYNITVVGSKLRYAYTAAWGIDAGDVSNDGRDDIVVTNRGSSDKLHILYQDQQGNLSEAKGVPCRVTKQGWPSIGDLNGDGLNDVAVGGWDKNLSIVMQWKGEINGSIWNMTTDHPINMVSTGDILNDGLVDLVTANTVGKSSSFYYQEDRFYATWVSGPLVQPAAFDEVTVHHAIDSGGGTTWIYFSWDNSSWSSFTNGTKFTSTNRPTKFWLKFYTYAPVAGKMDFIRYIRANLTPSSFPTDVGLDVGIDGTVEWSLAGEMKIGARASSLEDAITAYVQDPANTPDGEGMVTVPIGIRSSAAGNLRVYNLNIEYNNASTMPELHSPGYGVMVNATPSFQFEADDSNGDSLMYVLQITTTDFDDDANTTTYDLRQSRYNQVPGEGFDAGMYAPGATATFVTPTRYALEDDVTYRWRVTGYDSYMLGQPSDLRTFTVDSLVPQTWMTSPAYSTELDFTVNWTARDPSPGSGLRIDHTFDVEYRRSTDSTWTAWLTGATVNHATFHGEEGTIYHFRMRAWDNVDNAGPLTGGEGDTTTRVDTLDPTMFIHSPLEGEVVTDQSLELRVEARDGAFTLSDGMVLYKMDESPWNTMTRSYSDPGVWEVTLMTDGMDDGDHTVAFRATDDVGHMVQVSRDLVIDNNDPTCLLSNPVEDTMVSGPLHVQVEARDALGIDYVEIQVSGLPSVSKDYAEYNADSGYWEIGLNTSGLDEGIVHLSARAWDTSGLSSERADPISLRVDNTPPRLVITEPTNGSHIEGTMKIVHVMVTDMYFDTSVDVVRVRIDDDEWYDMAYDRRQFTLLWDMIGFADGEHTISATATDAAGHRTEVTAVVHIDNTAPEITFVSPVKGKVLSGLVTLDALVEDLYLDKAQADIDGALWTDIIGQEFVIDTRDHEDGTHTINIWAMDVIGHETERSMQVVFDNTPPVLTAVDVPSQGDRVAGEVSFVLTVKDANGLYGITVDVDGTVVTPSPVVDGGTLRWTFPSAAYPDGSHNVTITVEDVAFNKAIMTWEVMVDNTPPTVDVRSPGDRADGVVRFVVEVTDASGVASVQLRLGDGDWMVMVHEAEGVYVHEWSTETGDNEDLRYSVRATDGLGNTGETEHKVEIANFNVMTALAVLAMVAAAVVVAAFLYIRRGGSGEST